MGQRIMLGTVGMVGAVALLAVGRPAGAQVGVVVNGRVEDAASRAPVAGARVSVSDSSAVFTDGDGGFAILIPRGEPLSLFVEQYGYLAQQFDLAEGAGSRISVLLLEPAPIELEGVSVIEEAPLTELLEDLGARRDAYQGSVRAFDRADLARLRGMSVMDFVQMRAPRVFECSVGRSGLCVRGRSRSFRSPFPEIPVLVCVDSWESWGASRELGSLDLEAVALVEIYGSGRDGIRVYTPGFITHSARTGRRLDLPLQWGC